MGVAPSWGQLVSLAGWLRHEPVDLSWVDCLWQISDILFQD